MGTWPAVSLEPSCQACFSPLPCPTGGMYHGDLTEKLKSLYKLHLPPGECFQASCCGTLWAPKLSGAGDVPLNCQHTTGWLWPREQVKWKGGSRAQCG